MKPQAGSSSKLPKKPKMPKKPTDDGTADITLYLAKTEEDLKGIRVVRGRDFDYQKKRGTDCKLEDPKVRANISTEGVVGTCAGLNLETGEIRVVWDSGHSSDYRGNDGAYDLRVYDSGPSGKRFSTIKCTGNSQCKSKKHSIHGMVFRCQECPNVYLCTQCYMWDEHDVTHKFIRHDEGPNVKGVGLSSRESTAANRKQSRGIFKGTEVERGPDWNKMIMSDGGEGSKGIVSSIVWYKNADRSAAEVKWEKIEPLSYKLAVGHEGLMKLKYTTFGKAKAGWPYYFDHLPHLKLPVNALQAKKRTKAKVQKVMKSNGHVATKPKDAAATQPTKKRKRTLRETDVEESNAEPAPKKRLVKNVLRNPVKVKPGTSKSRVSALAKSSGPTIHISNHQTTINYHSNNNNNNIQQGFRGRNFLTPQERFVLLNSIYENFVNCKFGELLKPGDTAVNWHEPQPRGENNDDQPDGPDIEELFNKLSLQDPKLYRKGMGLTALVNWEFRNVKTKLPKVIRSNKDRYAYYKSLRRKGAETDTEIIKECFKKLTGNDVMLGLNLKKREDVRQFFSEVAQRALLLDAAYVVIVVSSHGLKDINSCLVITDHLETVCPFRDMIYHLKLDLPILCFMQLCQTEVGTAREFLTFNQTIEDVRVTGNYFGLMAGVPMQKAYRNQKTGSYFIQALTKYLEKDRKLPEQLIAMQKHMKDLKSRANQQVLSVYWPMEFPLGTFEF